VTDLRLIAPALAAWAASVGVLLGLSGVASLDTRHAIATRLIQAAIVVALVAIVWGCVSARSGSRRGSVVTISAVAVAIIAAGAQVSAWSSPALTSLMGTHVDVSGVVAGAPRESIGVVYVPVSTRHVSGTDGPTTRLQVPISVTVPRFSAVPIPGTHVEISGRLRPAGDSVRVAAYLQADDALAATAPAGIVDRAASGVRRALHDSLPSQPVAGSALVAGLAIGDENAMSPELVEQMRMSGLSHLTAVSGGNVAIVVGTVLALAWMLRLGMLARVLAALIALVFYVVVVHPEPSVLRAGVMGAVVVVSLLVGGRRPGPSVLAIAVMILVVLVPSLSVSWGFALSVAATAGIVMLTPGVTRRFQQMLPRLPTPVIVAASLTLAAQLATAPVLLAMGATIGIAAVPANLLAMPVVPLVTVAGLGAALIALVPVLGPLAAFIAWVGAMAGQWIASVAIHASGVDLLRIRGSPLIAGLGICAVIAGFLLWRRAPTFWRVPGIVLLVATVALWAIYPPARRVWPPENWIVVQCDVGQGDGLVIAPFEDSGAVVVDTGMSARAIDRCLEDLGVDHIAVLVLTHFHADHVNGVGGVLDGRRVDSVVTTVAHEPPEQVTGVAHELARRGIRWTSVRAGSHFSVGSDSYRIIWPRRIITSGRISAGSVANNASIVIDARVRGLRVLLTGDIEPPAQTALLTEQGGFDVVKIPHHGSPHQHPRFASWADAEVAIVSVGADNSFGHPADSTIAQWQESGATVVRTDLHGDVAIVIDHQQQVGWVPRRGP
jgi:competence protein ComEC